MNKQLLSAIILSAVLATSGAMVGNVFANHGATGDVDKVKVGDCDNIQIKDSGTTECQFQLTYTGDPALVLDSVPAEWTVTGDIDVNDNCDISTQKGSKNRGATTIECDASTMAVDLTVTIQTRESPNGKWFKPTFCGDLALNNGAVAIETADLVTPIDSTGPLTATTEDLSDDDLDGFVVCDAGEIVDMCPEDPEDGLGDFPEDGCPDFT